jgi:HD-like signal output (HDOD) protein
MDPKVELETKVAAHLKSRQLATLLGVVQRVNQLVANPNSSAKELAKVISSDIVLSVRILKIVNSSGFGLQRKINGIEHAIVIMGQRQLGDLCTGIAALSSFGVNAQNKTFDRPGLWRHSLGTAVLSKLLQSRIYKRIEPDLFVAGLLCNIGRVVLDQYFPNEFAKVLQLVAERNMLLAEAELEILGVTHAEIGFWAVKTWGISSSLANAVRWHHGPEKDQWGMIVNVAYVITHALGVGSPGDKAVSPLISGILSYFKMDEPQLVSFINTARTELRSVEPLFTSMTE